MFTRYRFRYGVVFLTVAVFAIAACSSDSDGEEPVTESQPAAPTELTIKLTSDAFAEGTDIPEQFTCDGDDVSPALAWSGVPRGTQSIALIADDPDAPGGTWVHWVLFGVPRNASELEEAMPSGGVTALGAKHGKNSFGKRAYGGPCPPQGGPHRYFFKLFALDAEPELEPGASKQDLIEAMDGHVLAQGQLMGRYKRR